MLTLGKDYHVDITPKEYVGKFTAMSDKPSVVKVEEGSNNLIAVAVGEAVVTFQVKDTEVKTQVSITVVPKEGGLEIAHATLPEVKDFPDLSMLTGAVNTEKIADFEATLGLRNYEATRWEASAHLYVTPEEKRIQTNLNRVNYYYKPQDGGSPYITAQVNCMGSIEEAEHSKDFAQWLKTNGFDQPIKSIKLNDGSKALATENKDLSLKCWIEKKVFFMIIEPLAKGNGTTAIEATKPYSISPIPARNVLYVSGVEAATPVAIYSLSGVLLYQTESVGGDTLSIPTERLADGVYLLVIADKPYRIVVAH